MRDLKRRSGTLGGVVIKWWIFFLRTIYNDSDGGWVFVTHMNLQPPTRDALGKQVEELTGRNPAQKGHRGWQCSCCYTSERRPLGSHEETLTKVVAEACPTILPKLWFACLGCGVERDRCARQLISLRPFVSRSQVISPQKELSHFLTIHYAGKHQSSSPFLFCKHLFPVCLHSTFPPLLLKSFPLNERCPTFLARISTPKNKNLFKYASKSCSCSLF